MKKLILSLFAIATLALLLTSCSTQSSTVSIKKRHFNKGYYVAVNHKQKAQVQETNALAVTEKGLGQAEKELAATPAEVEIPTSVFAESINNKEANAPLASSKKVVEKEDPLKNFKPASLKEIHQLQQISEYVHASKKNDSHSLVWTIIVVLLLLWLLSFLMGGWGLGSILHLLLIVAILLLILMLLGII